MACHKMLYLHASHTKYYFGSDFKQNMDYDSAAGCTANKKQSFYAFFYYLALSLKKPRASALFMTIVGKSDFTAPYNP